ncbi:MAG: nucleotide exchange factor GrpE [Ectothiorhodospiraceae bacterium]|jgi:molecular chaperone GrpE
MADEQRKRHKAEPPADLDQRKEPVVESEVPDVGAEAEASAVESGDQELRKALEEAQAKAEENWNQFLRARAELENVRRRAERDVEQARRHALEKFATEMLAVRDSLEMGVAAAQEPDADVAKLREGSELTLRMLAQAMEKFDIAELNPKGERFDPGQHEAMAAQESAEHEPNTVIHVVQKGYQLGERLLRPAMVIVSKPAADPQQGGHIDEQA